MKYVNQGRLGCFQSQKFSAQGPCTLELKYRSFEEYIPLERLCQMAGAASPNIRQTHRQFRRFLAPPPSSKLPETPSHSSALRLAVRCTALRFSIVMPLYCFRSTSRYRVSTNHKFRASLETNHEFWAIFKRGVEPKIINQDRADT